VLSSRRFIPPSSSRHDFDQGLTRASAIRDVIACPNIRLDPAPGFLAQSTSEENTSMADLEQLKQKYLPVLHTLEVEGAQVQPLSLDGEQLALNATVVSEASKNRVWDSIKSVDSSFADLKHNIQVVAGQQVYTVQPGDNLSKISKYFYGNANKYMDIAKANGLADPDKIKVG
jgi:nucleoid-associated protein YgaU